MPHPAIEVRELWQAYSAKWILRDVSFSVTPGELAVLTGVGKTTLLNTIAGVKSPERGIAMIHGCGRRQTADAERAARLRTVFLPSDVFLPKDMTVVEYLECSASLFDVDPAQMIDRAEQLLALFALTDVARQSTASLSDGQRKKTGLVAALLTDRDVLLLDEPFSGGLDPAGILAVKRILRRRADNGQTILLTTPVTEFVTEIADRLLVLRDGELIHNLTRSELLDSAGPDSTLAGFLETLVFPHVHERVDEFLKSIGTPS